MLCKLKAIQWSLKLSKMYLVILILSPPSISISFHLFPSRIYWTKNVDCLVGFGVFIPSWDAFVHGSSKSGLLVLYIIKIPLGEWRNKVENEYLYARIFCLLSEQPGDIKNDSSCYGQSNRLRTNSCFKCKYCYFSYKRKNTSCLDLV